MLTDADGLQAVAHAVLYPEGEEVDAAQNYAAMLLPPPAIPAIPAIPAAKQLSTEVGGNTSPTSVGPVSSGRAAQEEEAGGEGGGREIQPPIAGPPPLPFPDNVSENCVISAPGPGMDSEKDTNASGCSPAVGEEPQHAASPVELQQGDLGEGAAY
jgi:hypothetical protein